MGVYAEVNGVIYCADKKVASKVMNVLEKMKNEKAGTNFDWDNLEQAVKEIYLNHSSGRIQNLTWQMEQIWKAIEKIKGVINFEAPFMVEDEGCYFSNEIIQLCSICEMPEDEDGRCNCTNEDSK